MKIVIAPSLALACATVMAQGSHSTKGYVKKDGTCVAPSYDTNPNATKVDNYSSKGNFNPATGKEGTKNPFAIEAPRPTRKR